MDSLNDIQALIALMGVAVTTRVQAMSPMRLRIVAGLPFFTATLVVIATALWNTETTVAKPPDAVALPPAAQQIVKNAFEAVNAIQDPERKSMQLMGLAWGQFRRGELDSARKTLRGAREAAEAIPPTQGPIVPHPIIIVGETQSEMGDKDAAHATFAQAVKVLEARGDRERFDDWMNFARSQLKLEGRAKSRETLEAYRRFLIRDSARDPRFTSRYKFELLTLLAHLEGFGKALQTVYEPKDLHPADPETNRKERRTALLAIVRALEDGDQTIGGPILMEAHEAIEADSSRLWAQDFEEIAKARARMRQFPEALTAAKQMSNDPDAVEQQVRNDAFNQKGFNLFREAIALVEIAQAQLKANDRAGALETADTAVAVVDQIHDARRKPRPLADATDFYVDARDFHRALRTAKKIEDPGWRLGELHAIARGQADAGDEAGRRDTLREALEIARRVGQTDSIAIIQAKLGDVNMALKTLDAVPAGNGRQSALKGVAIARASLGDAETALRLIESVPEPEFRSQAWIDAAKSLRTPAPKQNR